jgi:hypothetical protein
VDPLAGHLRPVVGVELARRDRERQPDAGRRRRHRGAVRAGR